MVSIAWLLFWIAGLPDYYQQYSTTAMILFDLAILPFVWLVVYQSANRSRPKNAIRVSFWWSFYISVPLFFYDLLYCGVYLGHGLNFLIPYQVLSGILSLLSSSLMEGRFAIMDNADSKAGIYQQTMLEAVQQITMCFCDGIR